ncbi:MAG: PPOX class F420-dependent oxidoreductase [Polyangiaceae bacterium]|nr:PPOX class F420-dependent oxidoreductase [Polyangiaceae bacterium]
MPTPLDAEEYVNLESFKRDGTGVLTPVWVAPLDGKLVIFTLSESYKVKRIRRDPRVRLAACDVRGGLRGPFHEGSCRILEAPDTIAQAHEAMRRKYGWKISIGDFFSRLVGRMRRRTWLEVTLTAPG